MSISCVCEWCQKVFYVKYASFARRYCSHECANMATAKDRRTAINVTITCEYCKNPFEVYKNDSRVKGNKIHYCSKQCASNAAKTGKAVNCPICGKEFYTTRGTYCSSTCARKSRIGTGGKVYLENGYKVRHIHGYNKKGNAKEHRLVAENMLGRKLLPTEVVHHKNGIKTDNRPENLEVLERGKHSQLHRKEEMSCGKMPFRSNA